MPFDITNPTSVKRAASAFHKSLTVIGDSLLAAGDKNYPQSNAFVVSDRHFKDHGPKRMTFGSVSPTRIMLAQSKLSKSIYVSDGSILLGPIAQYNDEGTNFRDIVDCDGVLPRETEQIEVTDERSKNGHWVLGVWKTLPVDHEDYLPTDHENYPARKLYDTGAYLNPVYLATALLYLKKQGADTASLRLTQKSDDHLGPIVIHGSGDSMAVIMPMRAD